MAAKKLSCGVVQKASPTSNVLSFSRKKLTCPGVCPGVWISVHPGISARLSSAPSPGNARRREPRSTGPRGSVGESSGITPPPAFQSGAGYSFSPVRYGNSSGCA